MFGDRRLPLVERIEASPAGGACGEQSGAENRRLAYVGLTRARDAVVLAAPADGWKDAAWIHSFKGDYLLPSGDELRLPDGKSIRTVVQPLEANGEVAGASSFTPRRLAARSPLAGAVRETVMPSSALAVVGAAAGEVVGLGERIRVNGDDMTLIGTALHALIAAEVANPLRADRVERGRALLDGYGVGSFIDAEEAFAAADRLRAWIAKRFSPQRVLTEYPIVHTLADGRVVRGWVDVLVETGAGWIVIDHKSSPRPRAEWLDEVSGYSGQLAVYRDALRASGKSVAGTWVHFPVGGGVVEVTIANDGYIGLNS
jgi:hypothetical protein